MDAELAGDQRGRQFPGRQQLAHHAADGVGDVLGSPAVGLGQVGEREPVRERIVVERALQILGAQGEPGDRLGEVGCATEVDAVVGAGLQRRVRNVHGHRPIGAAQEQSQHLQGQTEGQFEGLGLRGRRVQQEPVLEPPQRRIGVIGDARGDAGAVGVHVGEQDVERHGDRGGGAGGHGDGAEDVDALPPAELAPEVGHVEHHGGASTAVMALRSGMNRSSCPASTGSMPATASSASGSPP